MTSNTTNFVPEVVELVRDKLDIYNDDESGKWGGGMGVFGGAAGAKQGLE